MDIKAILVQVDGDRPCAGRIGAAVDIARRFDAHLSGLYVDLGFRAPVMVDAPISGAVIERLEEERAARAQAAARCFEAATAGHAGPTEFRQTEGDAAGELARAGRYVDLLVVGQPGNEHDTLLPGFLPDALLMDAARPVLMIPYIGPRESLGRRVLVAWNGSREAARAVGDAMPLLARAEEVEVLSINPDAGDAGEGDVPGAAIAQHLARHGIRAVAHASRADDIDVGDVLLSRAADQDFDLLVMGAYGHSRLREFVLGGATRHMLKHMTVPVLMSH
jgi:nucleotide-binding universal stress UspA family protein